ncbi:hypothetical protein ACO22_00980 [Paracoccidioides brasiliensis]|uniref:Uncharacterized protein n=1 Tax=Paracoccidioides brasiliensis TaxID=121759 RepID=A0A1D2JMS1_PARBR|nr:hypothetical protein ACO22_00980 [Paracoccidioides brasiliensis]
MWLFRGAQSAVFYYAACTPCAASIHRRRRKKDAARTHREPPPSPNGDIITDQPPIVFHQPFPFSTNSYWDEEIGLGPGPPAKRAGRKNLHNLNSTLNNHNHNKTGRTGSQGGSPTPKPDAKPKAKAKVSPQNAPGSSLAEAVTGVLEDLVPSSRKDKEPLMNQLGDRWNRIRYQREDEVLWGGKEVKGSSVGLSGRGRADTGSSTKYYVARNPDVNDLHPPIVCGPTSRAETRWMLQPPPSAKVMAGKVRSNLSVHDARHGIREKITGIKYKNVDGASPRADEGEEQEDSVSPSARRRPNRRSIEAHLDGTFDGTQNWPNPTQPNISPTARRRVKPPPLHVATDNFYALSPTSPDDVVLLPPRPVFAPGTSASSSLDCDRQISSPDDHRRSRSPSINSRSNSPSPNYPQHSRKQNSGSDNNNTSTPSDNPSPATWHWPWQSIGEEHLQSRPASKATADSGKAFSIQQQQHQQQQQHDLKLHTAWPSSTLDIDLKHTEHVRTVHVEVRNPKTSCFDDDETPLLSDDCLIKWGADKD